MALLKEQTLERRLSHHRRPFLVRKPPLKTAIRYMGVGLITGAADDDPSAIGTYASAGAAFGPSILWTAPVLFPMMVVVVYLASKLGHVTGQGLAGAIKSHYARWILWSVVAAVLVGNTIEAAADLGGIAASCNLILRVPFVWIVAPVTVGVLALQTFGSYALIRAIFRWLALALLAYVGSALLTHPGLGPVIRGTLLPAIHFDRNFMGLLVAVIGTSLSPYLYVWQASQEVEADIAMGRRRRSDRKGTSALELRHSAWDVTLGMLFSNLVMYFIILSTAATLYPAGDRHIATAAQAALALRPLAGAAAAYLFAIGVIGVGVLAVPVMTTGAAYMLCEALGCKLGLAAKPAEAKTFYAVIAAVTILAGALNFFGLNPIHALVGAGIVQGFLAPALMALIMLMTGSKKIMGPWVNHPHVNFLGWAATALVTAAIVGLLFTFL